MARIEAERRQLELEEQMRELEEAARAAQNARDETEVRKMTHQ